MASETLRDPHFLLWLQQYVDVWEGEDETYEIRRRADGWLEAYRLSPYERAPLAGVLDEAELAEHFDLRSLGPRPVIVSASLMRHWLAPEQAERLKNAWRVGSGQRRIMEAVEQTLQELPAETLKARWLSRWQQAHEESGPLPPAARRAHATLHEEFRQT